MGLLVRSGQFEHEITEDGDLLFLDYDIEYDIAMAEFGEPATDAMEVLSSWSINSTSMFIGFIEQLINAEVAVVVARAWAKKIAKYTGLKTLYGMSVKSLFGSIQKAITSKSTKTLTFLNNRIGQAASEYQWKSWGFKSKTSSNSEDLIDANLNLALSMVLIDYIRIVEMAISPVSFWSRYGGFLNGLRNIPSNSTEAIVRRQQFKDEVMLFDYSELVSRTRQIERDLVGEAVKAILKAQ